MGHGGLVILYMVNSTCSTESFHHKEKKKVNFQREATLVSMFCFALDGLQVTLQYCIADRSKVCKNGTHQRVLS